MEGFTGLGVAGKMPVAPAGRHVYSKATAPTNQSPSGATCEQLPKDDRFTLKTGSKDFVAGANICGRSISRFSLPRCIGEDPRRSRDLPRFVDLGRKAIHNDLARSNRI